MVMFEDGVCGPDGFKMFTCHNCNKKMTRGEWIRAGGVNCEVRFRGGSALARFCSEDCLNQYKNKEEN